VRIRRARVYAGKDGSNKKYGARELGTEKNRDSLLRYLLGVCNPDKSEVAPNEKQLSDEFADVVGGISNETLFRRVRC
jgi:hypothetical protein